jgi:hypothetical protein
MRRSLTLAAGALVVAAALSACSGIESHGDRVWRPGDPDPTLTQFYGPWHETPIFVPEAPRAVGGDRRR